MLRYDRNLKQVARGLRNGMTRSEQMLWARLRGRQVQGIQFYQQKPLGVYILDFYAPKARLVVEVDGPQHLELEHGENDARRDAYLTGAGLKVLRFSNTQIFQELNEVVTLISKALIERTHTSPHFIEATLLLPPFRKGGPGGIPHP